jgi:3-oxoacyl-[acyl-carrier protein] reductase
MTGSASLPTVLVTGGGRGIGRAIVEVLARAGYRVMFTYNASEGAATQLCTELERGGFSAEAVRCDLRVPDAADHLARLVLEQRGAPYGVVCNAGASVDALAPAVDVDRARELFQLNFFATVQLVKALSRPMARNRSGRIVLMSSVLATHGNRGTAIYAATKGALESYMRGVIDEVARKGVTINCIRPGLIATDMTASRAEVTAGAVARIPARRLGTPEDVASVVRFLLSDQAAYVNGTSIDVDGGMTAVLGGP